MDTSLLSDISQWLSAAILVLSAILLNLIAPNMAMGWVKKLLWVSIVLGVWMVFVQPYVNDLKAFFICLLSTFTYQIITEDTAIFLVQALLFMVTFKLTMWLFDSDGPTRDEHTGFTTRKLK